MVNPGNCHGSELPCLPTFSKQHHLNGKEQGGLKLKFDNDLLFHEIIIKINVLGKLSINDWIAGGIGGGAHA
jgi:hypothetical protein